MKIFMTVIILLASLSSLAQRSAEQREQLFGEATKKLKDAKIEEKTPQVGDTFPDIELMGKKVSHYLKDGPLIITFYRGGWCPYCVGQLKEINSHLAQLTKGATLIAISPEKDEEVRKTKQKNKLNFPMISDPHNQIAKKLNLTFQIDKEVVKEYKSLGIDLQKSQGNDDYELPMPATFVIGKDGKINYAFADADYTKRAKNQEIIKAVKDAQ